MSIPPPPAELHHLAQALGAEALFKLIDTHGGIRIYIPVAPSPDSDLVALIGMDGANNLARELGATMLKVPLARAWVACVLRSRGLSLAKIARHMRTTETAIGRLLQGQPDTRPLAARDERQMGLPL